jgi:hypothetical protein
MWLIYLIPYMAYFTTILVMMGSGASGSKTGLVVVVGGAITTLLCGIAG